jgi:hypothetical protein
LALQLVLPPQPLTLHPPLEQCWLLVYQQLQPLPPLAPALWPESWLAQC